MRSFQTIMEDNIPVYAVLPFGDSAALDDYADEIWALKAVEEFEKSKDERLYSLSEAKKMLDEK
jgi:hypothetical protein